MSAAVERPRQEVVECDPSDGKVHVRRSPGAATIEPALCGKRGQTTITSAWGFYGPGGDGFDDVCRECVEAERSRGRS